MRYLLQIFTEANCLELSLLMSVLLTDSASISRITNAAIRTSSLQLCRQLRNGLKDMTRWSFQECLGYRSFFINLQPQIYLLDNFVLQKEAIPFVESKFQGQPGVQFLNNKAVATKNVRKLFFGEFRKIFIFLFILQTQGIKKEDGELIGANSVHRMKRSDSIRSSAGIHSSPNKFDDMLRKSKTELNLSVKKRPPVEQQGGSVSHGTVTPNSAGPTNHSQDNSNCVLM